MIRDMFLSALWVGSHSSATAIYADKDKISYGANPIGQFDWSWGTTHWLDLQ